MLKDYFIKTQKKAKGESSPWADSIFEDAIKLGADKRGELGEKWVSDWIGLTDAIVNEDITTKTLKEDGHYDMKVNGKRLEIKTAYRGSSNGWQHENVYKADVCDINIFVDIDFNQIYLTFVKREEIPFGQPNDFFGKRKRATLRAGKTDGYKFDFSNTQIKLLKEKGRTLEINPLTTTEEQIISFINLMLTIL